MDFSIRMIHGIHSPEGHNNMSAFRPYIIKASPESTIVTLYQYGFMGFWRARWDNDCIARDLADIAAREARKDSPPEVWLTHSNGAALAYLAVERYGAQPIMIVNVNPALDRNLSAKAPRVETIHSPGDRVVYLSRFLPLHIWGDQGRAGYNGQQLNTVNHDVRDFAEPMYYSGHSGLFSSVRAQAWADFIVKERIRGYLG